MTELSSMYSYLKGISGKQTPGFSDANYLLPRPLNDTYLIPPAARPVSTSSITLATSPSMVTTSTSCPTTPLNENFVHFYTNLEALPTPINLLASSEYNTPPVPLPIQLDSVFSKQHKSSSPAVSPPSSIPTTPKDNTPAGLYLEMHSSDGTTLNKMTCGQLCCDEHNNLRDQHSIRLGHTTSVDSISGNRGVESSSRSGTYRKGSTSSTSTKHSQHGVQDELVEIINDFKNNVFTIGEVEKLVASWQNRHDVQQSFKDKQEQLNAMREEYDRIQQSMKQQLKRPTPFERIRKFFSREKSKHTMCSAECRRNTKDSANSHTGNICHRPASSLSLRSSCSSGSSGRMSTESGTSLGDSGTHSDPDDKKNSPNDTQLHLMQQDIRCKLSSSSLHYDIPPSSTELRLARPPPLTDLTEYVKPDNPKPNLTLGLFARSTSLTEDDTIHEDHEHSSNSIDETGVEKQVEKCEANFKEDVSKNIDEADREIAVVEVHPPPTKEIDLPSLSNTEDTTTGSDEIDVVNEEDNKAESIDFDGSTETAETMETNNCKEQSDEAVQTSDTSTNLGAINEDDTTVLVELNDVVNEMINDLNACNKNERITNEQDDNCSITEPHNCNLIAVDYEYNSDEESAKETDRLLENLQIHDYINVSGQFPPPVPHRGKYSHVTL